MKKQLFLTILTIVLCGCGVRHYKGKQLQVRVAGAPKEKDSLNAEGEGDDALFSLPGELIEDPDSVDESISDDMSTEYDENIDMVDEDAMKELDRLMRGLPD